MNRLTPLLCSCNNHGKLCFGSFTSTCLRRFSRMNSTKKNSHLRKYLENWTGASRLNKSSDIKRADQSKLNPLASLPRLKAISGRSYLIPTIYITRDLTPDILRNALAVQRVLRRMPIVIDLKDVSSNGSPHLESINEERFMQYLSVLKENEIHPVGITNASPEVQATARKLNLNQLIHDTSPKQPRPEDRMPQIQPTNDAQLPQKLHKETQNPQSTNHQPTQIVQPLLHKGHVRTGQQVYAEGTSLVVMGSVNSGGEVLSDGDIHVYGTLRGRAIAGLNGNDKAQIFASTFDAELVGIASLFTTCEDLEHFAVGSKLPTRIRLDERCGVQELKFESVDPL